VITTALVGLAVALAAAWIVLAVVVLALRTPGQSTGAMLRVFPDAFRLTFALYRDRELPSSVRWRLRIAVLYNIQPINLIPDFIPVIGFADNVVVLAWALRSTVRIAGAPAVDSHWRGTPASLAALYRALRLPALAPPDGSP